MLNPEAHLTYASSLSPPVDAKAKKRAYDAAYRATHKAELATKWAAYDAAHRAERRAYAAVYLYGITLNQKTAILKEQGEACAICGTTEPGTKGWHTDHKHGTKIVR